MERIMVNVTNSIKVVKWKIKDKEVRTWEVKTLMSGKWM
jgi:hypothetical protein